MSGYHPYFPYTQEDSYFCRSPYLWFIQKVGHHYRHVRAPIPKGIIGNFGRCRRLALAQQEVR